MFEWALQNDIIWLENASTIFGTKTTKIFGFFLLSSPRILNFCVHSNNLTTKLVFNVFVIPLTQSKLGGKEP
jgi:hypothetical protein